MSFWKVLGGVAAGVGAVVALPVAGPIGAVTLVGAAVGAAVGGTAGAIMSESDKEREEALKDAKAKMTIQEKKLFEQFEEQGKKIEECGQYYKLLIGLFAVGMAAANSDGYIATEEQVAIDEFVLGMAKSALPVDVKSQIEQLRSNPPNLKTAIAFVKELPDVNWDLYRNEIMMIINADGSVDEKEKEFLSAFDQLIA